MTTRREALRARSLTMAFLVELLTTPPIRTFAGLGEWQSPDGRVWSGVGELGHFSATESREHIAARTFTFGLQVQAQQDAAAEHYDAFVAAAATVTSAQVRGRDANAYLAIFGKDGALVDGALTLYASGVASRIRRRVAAGGFILECEAVTILDTAFPARSLYLTDADQQALFPGDRGLEYASVLRQGGRIGRWKVHT